MRISHIILIVLLALSLVGLTLNVLAKDKVPEWRGDADGPGDDQGDWEDLAKKWDMGYYDEQEEEDE